jgi:hypothetical protein
VSLYTSVVFSKLKLGAEIMSYLVGRIGIEVSRDELADALRLDTGRLGVSGALSQPSKLCAEAGRVICWTERMDPVADRSVYSLNGVHAGLFLLAGGGPRW